MDSEENKAPPASRESSVKKMDKPVVVVAPEPVKDVRYWAGKKGHLPKKVSANAFRGDRIHRGPHVAVIEQHVRGKEGLYLNSPLSEEQYDALVTEAYNIGIGESPRTKEG